MHWILKWAPADALPALAEAAITDLMVESFGASAALEGLQYWFEEPETGAVVFALNLVFERIPYSRLPLRHAWIVYNVCLARKWQSRGLSRHLFRAAVLENFCTRQHPEVRDLFLTVEPNNLPAVKLYRNAGFRSLRQFVDRDSGKRVCLMQLHLPVNNECQ